MSRKMYWLGECPLALGIAGSRYSKVVLKDLPYCFPQFCSSLWSAPVSSRHQLHPYNFKSRERALFLSHKNPRSHLTGKLELYTHPQHWVWVPRTKHWEEEEKGVLISLEPMEGLAPSKFCWADNIKGLVPPRESGDCSQTKGC